MKTKQEIRDEIRRMLKLQTEADRIRRSGSIRSSLGGLDYFRKASCVLIYLSTAAEVDTLAVIREGLASGKRIIVPRIQDAEGALDLREIRDLDADVENGKWGLLEPKVATTRRADSHEIDCVVVPGLAFDSEGNRLGRGGGYFDRLLAGMRPEIPRIGLAFSFQMVDALPIEPHDRPVHVVLTS